MFCSIDIYETQLHVATHAVCGVMTAVSVPVWSPLQAGPIPPAPLLGDHRPGEIQDPLLPR